MTGRGGRASASQGGRVTSGGGGSVAVLGARRAGGHAPPGFGVASVTELWVVVGAIRGAGGGAAARCRIKCLACSHARTPRARAAACTRPGLGSDADRLLLLMQRRACAAAASPQRIYTFRPSGGRRVRGAKHTHWWPHHDGYHGAAMQQGGPRGAARACGCRRVVQPARAARAALPPPPVPAPAPDDDVQCSGRGEAMWLDGRVVVCVSHAGPIVPRPHRPPRPRPRPCPPPPCPGRC